jgi:hypothetical protein
MRSRLLTPRSFGKGRSSSDGLKGTGLAVDTCRMAKKPEPPKLFWLTYRYFDGRAAGVVVIESRGLPPARLKASLAGADQPAVTLKADATAPSRGPGLLDACAWEHSAQSAICQLKRKEAAIMAAPSLRRNAL